MIRVMTMLYRYLVILCTVVTIGCSLDTNLPVSQDAEKSRGAWRTEVTFPAHQDLAILLPRDPDIRLTADSPGSNGETLLSREWLDIIGQQFMLTAVGDAFMEENWYEDWHIVSIRLAPCSPLTNTPGVEAERWCWPEVRVVWQPTQFDIPVRGIHRSAYSDDRAVHVLYHVLPNDSSMQSSSFIEEVKSGNRDNYVEFSRLRDRAIENLLTVAYEIRRMDGQNYVGINYREELLGDDDTSQGFLRLMQTRLSSLLQDDAVHTVTAFSLPEGRQPAGVDLWTFLAFEQVEGDLQIKTLEILDPVTGDRLAALGTNETISAANHDPGWFSNNIDESTEEKLSLQILQTEGQRRNMSSRINNPKETLVANTSCATCHSFNREIFNLHSLSYLEDDEITVSPRVVADVEHELEWIERWRNREFESRD